MVRVAIRSDFFTAKSFCLACLFSLPAGAADWEFAPSISLSQSYIDNILLVTSARAEEDFLTQAIPSFGFGGSGDNFDAFFAGGVVGNYYSNDNDRSKVFAQFESLMDFRTGRDRLGVEISADHFQRVIEPGAGVRIAEIDDSRLNLADTFAAYIEPRLRQPFGDTVALQASSRIGRQDFSVDQTLVRPLSDVDYERHTVGFGTSPQQQRIHLYTEYQYRRDDYEVFREFEYESLEAQFGVRVAAGVYLEGKGGVETDLITSTTEAGLDSSFWEAGLSFAELQNSQLRFGAGERFFGDMFYFDWNYETDRVALSVKYEEAPTTGADRAGSRELRVDVGQPGGFPGGLVGATSGIESDAFVSESWRFSLDLIGSRNTIAMIYFDEESRFIETNEVRDFQFARFGYGRQLGPRMTLDASVTWNRFLQRGNNEEYEEYRYRLVLDRTLSRKLSLYFGYVLRDIDSEGLQQNVFQIGLRFQPNPDSELQPPSFTNTVF